MRATIRRHNDVRIINIVLGIIFFLLVPVFFIASTSQNRSQDIRSRASGPNPYATPPASTGSLSDGASCTNCSSQCKSGFGVNNTCVNINDYNLEAQRRGRQCELFGSILSSLCDNVMPSAIYNDTSRNPQLPNGARCSFCQDYCASGYGANGKCSTKTESDKVEAVRQRRCKLFGSLLPGVCD